jgi:hypothetical protein
VTALDGIGLSVARKLDIAMGLLNHPQVLFLDEPTTVLDPEARAQMWQDTERLATDPQRDLDPLLDREPKPRIHPTSPTPKHRIPLSQKHHRVAMTG